MNLDISLNKAIDENISCKKDLFKDKKKIYKIISLISKTFKSGGKIFFCGNGGSAADAQHLVAELLVRLNPKKVRKALPAICLSMDPSSMTACGNDFNFNDVFSRPFEGLVKKSDLLFVLSTSGNSKNIANVLKIAKRKKIISVGLLGNNGGVAKKLTNINIVVNSKKTARIQEAHIFLGHFMLDIVEKNLSAKKLI